MVSCCSSVSPFLSTLSLRRATADEFYVAALTNISIHALLAESDCIIMDKLTKPDGISIHALLAESDLRAEGPKKARYKFLSTLSLRRATATPRAGRQAAAISIHALLAESDFFPCVIFAVACQFLSTLSLRRATDGAAFF